MSPTNRQSDGTPHARLADLLLIRDGESCELLTHVDECDFCRARLEDVCSTASAVQQTLLFEAELPVPEAAWSKIEQQLIARGVNETVSMPTASFGSVPQSQAEASLFAAQNKPNKPSMWASINTAIYTLAVAIAFTGAVSIYTFQGQQQGRVETQALQASIQSLMDNSRGLERVLQNVATQNRSLAQADQSAIDRLQWRLMMVDQRINESESSDDISYEQIKSLWSERIDALTQLNKLYYANHVAVNDGQL